MSILEEIIAFKKEEVRRKKSEVSTAELEGRSFFVDGWRFVFREGKFGI